MGNRLSSGYIDTRLQELHTEKLTLQDKLQKRTARLEAHKLEKQEDVEKRDKIIRSLQTENRGLRSEMERVRSEGVEHAPRVNLVSEEAIRQFVREEFLDDEEINMWLVPDAIEGPVYEKVIGKLVNVMNKTLSSVQVDLLGHRMTINFYPIPDEKQD